MKKSNQYQSRLSSSAEASWVQLLINLHQIEPAAGCGDGYAESSKVSDMEDFVGTDTLKG